jgi:hypothetical protein
MVIIGLDPHRATFTAVLLEASSARVLHTREVDKTPRRATNCSNTTGSTNTPTTTTTSADGPWRAPPTPSLPRS